MGKCFCKNHNEDGLIDTGTASATLHEALNRNEPDNVILNLLDIDTEGMARLESICTQYTYYVEGVSCQGEMYNCERDIEGWKPSDGYNGIECTTTSYNTYPLQFAVKKGRSFKVISAMLGKQQEAIYREQKTPSDNQLGSDQTYWLPLHYAASRGKSPEITELLIRAYPQALDVEDLWYKRGRTPRDLARRAGNFLDRKSLSLLMKPTSAWIDSGGTTAPNTFPEIPCTNQSVSGGTADMFDTSPEMPSSQSAKGSSDSGGSSAVLLAVVALISLALVAVVGLWLVRRRWNCSGRTVPAANHVEFCAV